MSNELARRCRRLDANPEANQPASNKVKNTSPRCTIRQTRAGSVSAVPCGVRRSFSLANKSLNPHRCWLLCQRAAAQRGSLSDSLCLLRTSHSVLLFIFKMGAQERQSISQSAPSLHPGGESESGVTLRCCPFTGCGRRRRT